MADTTNETNPILIFSYGTLKLNFPNYNRIQNLIRQNSASFIGIYVTDQSYPLIIGPFGIPYLVNLPGATASHRVKGELYSVSHGGAALLDEFEGVSIGHYERLPIRVAKYCEGNENDVVLVEEEAYFAHRSFGEKMWMKRGRIGLSEYSEGNGNEYVRKENRKCGSNNILDSIEMFLSS
ncbi:putative gamma-glutamylcyclotransferase At3g02910 [Mercurialis annua]|uniref:putative gamma-glutamylcyclotransferase At3g02910 n=1 Tax=Mercurialis annua TaxID=3986 RepID=UPI00215E4F40|nr:putative gamma-glutamylcyclotransferase At3g02910 [Mercurialis annua]